VERGVLSRQCPESQGAPSDPRKLVTQWSTPLGLVYLPQACQECGKRECKGIHQPLQLGLCLRARLVSEIGLLNYDFGRSRGRTLLPGCRTPFRSAHRDEEPLVYIFLHPGREKSLLSQTVMPSRPSIDIHIGPLLDVSADVWDNNKQQTTKSKQQTTNNKSPWLEFFMNHFPSQSICAIAFTLSLANQRSAAESRKEPAILRDPVVFDLETGCYSMQLHPNTTRSYISYCPIRVSTDHQPPFFRTKISSARKYTPRPVVHQARLNIHVARDCVFGRLGMRLFLGLGPGGLTFPPTPLLQGRGGAILTL